MMSKFKYVIFFSVLLIFGLILNLPNNYQEMTLRNIKIDPGLTNVGFAPFTLTSPKFNCRAFQSATKDITVLQIAFLYNTFGNKFDCFKKIISDPRLQSLEIALINEPGHRNKRLGKYEFLYHIATPKQYENLLNRNDARLKAKFLKYVRRLQRELVNLPVNVQLLINPGLESNVSAQAFATLAMWTREAFPSARIVYNPIKPDQKNFKISTADLYEQHGMTPQVNGPCITNTDGTDINFEYVKGRKSLIAIDAEKNGASKNYINASAPLQQYINQYANTCEFVYLWTLEDNFNGVDLRFRDPRERDPRNNNVHQLLAKEIKIAHTKGRFLPVDMTYNDLEKSSFDNCLSIPVVNNTGMAWAISDGLKSGLVWKQSEFPSRGTAIVVRGQKSQLFHNGKIIETFLNDGPYKHDSGNNKRTVFRSNSKPESYPFKTVLKIDNGQVCYPLPNPKVRND